mgnify:CR=1 FL=1
MDLVIHGCKIFYRGRLLEASIAIDHGKIVKIGKEDTMPNAEKEYRFQDKIMLPGAIDAHVHLRDQELSYKETFETGTMAAAAGGITTVLDMPNNKPVTDSPEALLKRMAAAKDRIYVNVGFYSAFPANPNDIYEIIKIGAIGFKINLSRQIGSLNVDDDNAITSYLKNLRNISFPVSIHAEDHKTISELEESFKSSNKNSHEYFLEAHPPIAEVKALKRMLNIARKLNIKLHIAHLTTESGLQIIKENRETFTCEVTPHHLFLTKDKIEDLNGFAIMEPPLRTNSDVQALWRGMREGVVDIVASDHAPHTIKEKCSENVWKIKPGIPGLETTLPLMMTAFSMNKISLSKLVELLCEKPAEIFNLKNKGKIEVNYDADLVILDFKKSAKIDPNKFKSKAKYSPFEGFIVRGIPIATFVGGTLIFLDNEVIEPAGRIIKSKVFHS